MNTLDDILQLLEVSQETLDEILSAIGWGELTQFDDDQSEMLCSVNSGHLENSWTYIESYLRKISEQYAVTPEEFDELAAAITKGGETLTARLGDFEDLCQRFQNGENAENSVTPPVTDSQIKDVAKESVPAMDGDSIVSLVKELARGSARKICSQVEGFAAMAQQDQDYLRDVFVKEYRREVFVTLQSSEFKARIDQGMIGGSPEEQKKQLSSLLFGQTTPVKLLSSSS